MLRPPTVIVRLLLAGLVSTASGVVWAGGEPKSATAMTATPAPSPRDSEPNIAPPLPRPAKKPTQNATAAVAIRKALVGNVRLWGIQLQQFEPAAARQRPFDMLVTDPNGLKSGQTITQDEVALLRSKPDGTRRLLISYLSIGEAEDYRPDYFTAEYMTEDAPDWLLSENERWKGNRRISFCEEGWQRTILGDDDGKSVYNSIEWSPLYRIIDLGFDGVYLDRADVFAEVGAQCPDAAKKMVAFIARLAAHARKKNPNFIVILQNAEELLQYDETLLAIDAVVKEDLFYGVDHTESANDPGMTATFIKNLKRAHNAGKPVFVLDYLKDPEKRALDKSKIETLGFIPYFAPRALDDLWSPGGPN